MLTYNSILMAYEGFWENGQRITVDSDVVAEELRQLRVEAGLDVEDTSNDDELEKELLRTSNWTEDMEGVTVNV